MHSEGLFTRSIAGRLGAALALIALGLAPRAAAAVTVETRTVTLAGETAQVDVYDPGTPPRALAVIAHGFTRSRAQHGVLAALLAEEGLLVAVPDLPHFLRHRHNGDAIVDLVRALEAERDALPVVLIGTSAGGLASLLAAPRVPRLILWVGLDPVDNQHLAEDAARSLKAQAVVLRGPNSPCNVFGSAKTIGNWLPPGHREIRIDGASHCDFEDTTDAGCESFCGSADPAVQGHIIDVTLRAVRAALRDER
jgi:pimeloyl-ACP methyl ester carboxylesterase